MANGKTCDCERLTMNMPKKLCEDISKLLWTEKTQINLSSAKATKRLWEVLDSKENSFTINIPMFIEKAFAIGNGALVEYKSNEKTIIDYIEGDLIIPYSPRYHSFQIAMKSYIFPTIRLIFFLLNE